MEIPKAIEMKGLIDKGTLMVVDRKEVGKNANILGGRLVLDIKGVEKAQTDYKTRFVVQGHDDRYKKMLVNKASTTSQQSIRVLVTINAVFGYEIWAKDVSQDYLQAN